jgi:hypothetical protein
MVKNLGNLVIVYFLIGLSIFSMLMLLLVFESAKRKSGRFKNIESVENVSRVGLEYFVTYLIPFLAVDLLNIRDIISILILFGIMGIIYVKSDLVYMNPMLNLRGFNLYKVKSDGNELMIITRKRRNQLEKTEEVIELGENVVYGR